MSYVGQIIDIFVSSPGDVSDQRDAILMIVQSWNQRNGRSKKLFFNCLRWEDVVAADIGDSGQAVINKQIGDNYDIFLGVMWARFGSPTLNAESGTEEEFMRAVERHQAGEPIKVSFLFCTADIPVKKLDGTQYSKVQEFKHRAQEKGCLTREFVDDASLINSINLILDRFANTWEVDRPTNSSLPSPPSDVGHSFKGPRVGQSIAETDSDSPEEDSDEEEPGILDVMDEFAEHNSEFVNSLNSWAERLNSVQEQTSITTSKLSDLSKFGSPSPQQVREVLNNITNEMERFSSWCEDEMVNLEKIMEMLSRDNLRIIDLSRDFNDPIEDIISFRDALVELHQGIEGANKSIIEFADAVEKSPKMDKKLNKANRKVVLVHRRLAEKNRIFQDDVSLCISDLNERLSDS